MLFTDMLTSMHTTKPKLPPIHRPPKKDWHEFLGYTIASPIGIAACAVTTSTGIWLAARLGCDVLTYKTIRCYAWPRHPEPNIAYIEKYLPLTREDIGKTIIADESRPRLCFDSSIRCKQLLRSKPDLEKNHGATKPWRSRLSTNGLEYPTIALANSFGNQSMDPEWTKNDIQKAKQSLLEGQVLIVSIFGNTLDEWIQTAQLAVESGADIVEANFSCPNLNTNHEPIYTRPDDILLITRALVHAIPAHIPLILKCGVFTDQQLMEKALRAAAQAGARGICGINTIPMRVVNTDGTPTFGTRTMAGVSGDPIQKLALDFVKTACQIIHKENLNLVLIGVGGITMTSHFSQFFAAGATIALSATGMMWNPYLAAQYHEQSQKDTHMQKQRSSTHNFYSGVSSVHKAELAAKLFDIGVIKFGDFIFKSGIRSNNYVDMRIAISHPDVLQELALCLNDIARICNADILCPVPYAAVPVTTTLSMISGTPMVMARQTAKDHGTKKMIEGVYTAGQNCLLIEDVITTGISILETIKTVEAAGLKVTDVVVLIDRKQGGQEAITQAGYRFHAVFTLSELLSLLQKANRISQETVDMVNTSCEQTKKIAQIQQLESQDNTTKQNRALTYRQRAAYCTNPIAQRLLTIMETKKTNLIFSADVTNKKELLRLAELIGPEIAVLKIHCDIIVDYDQELPAQLRSLADAHNFLIWEDRKFADIGSTALMQYTSGIFRIADWADMVTVHSVAGDGTLKALKSTPKTEQAAMLLLAQMSSAHTLAHGDYTQATVKLASQYPDNVIGVICREKLSDNPALLHFTPGVQFAEKTDGFGQQYLTPETVINELQSDIIIVGRGILHAQDPLAQARRYKQAGWEAYEQRIGL